MSHVGRMQRNDTKGTSLELPKYGRTLSHRQINGDHLPPQSVGSSQSVRVLGLKIISVVLIWRTSVPVQRSSYIFTAGDTTVRPWQRPTRHVEAIVRPLHRSSLQVTCIRIVPRDLVPV